MTAAALQQMAAAAASKLCYVNPRRWQSLVGSGLKIAARACALSRTSLIFPISPFLIFHLSPLPPFHPLGSCPVNRFRYGILCVEIWTDGDRPYPTLSNAEVLQRLRNGGVHPRPVKCPPNIYQRVVQPCFRAHPAARTTFSQLVATIGPIFQMGNLRASRAFGTDDDETGEPADEAARDATAQDEAARIRWVGSSLPAHSDVSNPAPRGRQPHSLTHLPTFSAYKLAHCSCSIGWNVFRGYCTTSSHSRSRHTTRSCQLCQTIGIRVPNRHAYRPNRRVSDGRRPSSAALYLRAATMAC